MSVRIDLLNTRGDVGGQINRQDIYLEAVQVRKGKETIYFKDVSLLVVDYS